MQAALAASENTRMGGAQAHKREQASLERQIAQAEAKLAEVQASHDAVLARLYEYQAAVAKAIKYNARVIRETEKLDEMETPEVLSFSQLFIGSLTVRPLRTPPSSRSCAHLFPRLTAWPSTRPSLRRAASSGWRR